MEEIKVRELPEKPSIDQSDRLVIETDDGTKIVEAKHLKSLVITSMYFDNIEQMKAESTGLNEGDICETLGYYNPGDGGGAKYKITYNPGAIEDGKLVHYLSHSDTLRAEIILSDTINIQQFGAVGDGNTDDSSAIQAAIDNDFRIIEFSNNKIYTIKSPIEINKHDTLNIIINGNGATIYPHFTDGLKIYPDGDIVANISINNLNIDCTDATSAITVTNTCNLDINNCNITNISNEGIVIDDSVFISINKSHIKGSNTGSLIVLRGFTGNLDIEYLSVKNRAINISDCVFEDFERAIYIKSTSTTLDNLTDVNVNIHNCLYKSSVVSSCCVYVGCDIETVNIDANSVDKVSTFLYVGGTSSGCISCSNISCLNTGVMFDIGSVSSMLNLFGNIKTDSACVLFNNMQGKLHSNIAWNSLPNGASYKTAPIGQLLDSVYPVQYQINSGYSITTDTLNLNQARNIFVDWSSSTSNLINIKNGINGQLLYIISSTNKSIINTANRVVLSSSSIQLSTYKGILLKFDGSKWVQIQ